MPHSETHCTIESINRVKHKVFPTEEVSEMHEHVLQTIGSNLRLMCLVGNDDINVMVFKDTSSVKNEDEWRIENIK